MAVEVASAYVSLQASTRDLDRTIKAGLENSVKHADAAGDKMGQKLSSQLGRHLERSGTQSGDAFGKTFAPKVAGSGAKAMQGLAQAMLGGAEGIGSQVGGGISGGLVSALSKGADKAVGVLSKLGTEAGWSSGVVSAGMVAAGGVAVIGTAAVAAAGELYKIGETWDAVADGITFKTGLVGDQLNAVRDSVKNVARDTAAEIGDIANVAAALTKGFKIPPGEGLEQLTQQISEYNAAAQENGADPINIREFIKAMKQMKIDGDVPAMQKQLDDLYKVTQNTTLPMNDLIRNLRLLGPTADALKIPANTLVQIISGLEEGGLNAETAMIGLRTAWKKLQDDPDPSNGFRRKLDEIKGLLTSTSDEARIAGEKMATEFFGNKAGPALAQAIKNGELELDNFNTKAGQTGLTIGEMTEQTGDFAQEWTKFKNWLKSDLEPVATAVFGGINDQLSYWTTSLRQGLGLLGSMLDAIKSASDSIGGNIATPNLPDWASPMGPAAPGILGGAAGGPGIGVNGGGGGNAASSILGGMAGASGGNVNRSGGLPAGVGGGGRGYMNYGATSAYLSGVSALQPGQWGSIDAIAAQFGLTMTSGYRDPNGPAIAGVAASTSYHGSGRAHDFSGTQAQMLAFANYMANNYGGQLKELIFDNPAFGRTINNGAVVGPFGAFYTANQAGPHNDHVHIAYGSGGRVRGAGTATSDSIPAWLSNGEHVLTAADVHAMGGQGNVYAFRRALHRADGGDIFKLGNVDYDGDYPFGPPADSGQYKDDPSKREIDLPPIFGDKGPGFVFGDSPMPRGPKTDPGWFFPWWWGFWNDGKLDPLTPSGKIRKGIHGFADGGAVGDEEWWLKAFGLDKHAGSGALPGMSDLHAGSGAAPGPAADALAAEQPDFFKNLIRTQGFTPSGGGGVAGTSSLAGFINMGNEVVGGLIDTGASLAQSAIQAATAAAGGAAAASAGPGGPLAGMAASAAANYGIQLGAAELKRISSYGFQLAGIGADSLISQLFPIGGPPRWIGYDYTSMMPQLGIQKAALTTIEQMGQQAIQQAFPAPAANRPNPAVSAAGLGPQELAPPPPPGPTVQIGSINGFSPEDVANQIAQKQRIASMQYGGRPY